MHSFARRSTVAATVMAIMALSPALLPAQQQAAPGPKWLGLLGCWSIAQTGTAPDAQREGRLVCITPTADANVADISAIADGKVVTTDRVDASGRSYPMTVSACTGTQSATWSGDQRRLFLKSAVTCDGVTRDMSALLSLSLGREWIDVRRVWSGHPDSAQVLVAKYRDVGLSHGVPADIAAKLRDYGMSIETGRIAASVPVGAPAIIEASQRADSSIVAAWLTESGQRFALDSREWRELADAGVSAQVRDAMDETVHPAADRDGHYVDEHRRWAQQASAQWDQGTGMRRIVTKAPQPVVFYDPWGYGVGYGAWLTGYRYGYLDFLGDGLGIGGIGLDRSLGYLFGYRRSVTGNVRPNVIVLKDAQSADGPSPVATQDPKFEEPNPVKAATAQTGRGGSSTTTAGSTSGSGQAPAATPRSATGRPR